MPSFLDAPIRSAYRAAHLGLRSYWFIRRPLTRGVLIALWHEGKVLLVKNSYRREHTFPGGYIKKHEAPIEAAARELREEVGIDISPERLQYAYHGVHQYEFRDDTLDIYELEVDARPRFAVDRREVVWADFCDPADLGRRRVVPHVEEYLRAHLRSPQSRSVEGSG
ncbi:MAG: NUDIX hydrolase [Myxococcota bacterium]